MVLAFVHRTFFYALSCLNYKQHGTFVLIVAKSETNVKSDLTAPKAHDKRSK